MKQEQEGARGGAALWAKESDPSCGGVGRGFASLSRGGPSITGLYDRRRTGRAGVGTGNRARSTSRQRARQWASCIWHLFLEILRS